MRILLLVHQFLPDYSAGTEILVLDLARELRRRGNDVQILTGFPGPNRVEPDESRFDRYEFDGLTVHRYRHAYVPLGGVDNVALLEYDNPLLSRFFAEILRDFKPDLAHAYHLSRLSTSPIEVCRRANVPMVFTATDFWFVCPLSQMILTDNRLCDGPSAHAGNCIKHIAVLEHPSAMRRLLNHVPDRAVDVAVAMIQKRMFPPTPHNAHVRAAAGRREFVRNRLNQVSRIIAPSRVMMDSLLHNGIESARVLHLPYGIDTSRIDRAEGKCRGEKLRVGFIGTLAPHKGTDVLINAAQRLAGLPLEIHIYGDGPANLDYPRQVVASAAGDSRIRMHGRFEHERVSEILAGLDVLIVPSLWLENTPLVVQEAQAAGCAVIASNRGGLSEQIRPEVDGLLFSPGDVAALAEILRRLSSDREFAAKLATAARPPISLTQQVDRLIVLYNEVISERAR